MASILVLENNEAMAALTRRWLEVAGHTVHVVARADAALDEIDRGEAFALYLLNLWPADGEPEGLRLARAIVDRQPNARIVFVTGDLDLIGEPGLLFRPVFVEPLDYRKLMDHIARVPGRHSQPGSEDDGG
ncbi:MAG TPA: hypothetical protein VKS60_05220 [Stellaceae bacterium]|nr:hypothetical protein [Stellaceae bacterium]